MPLPGLFLFRERSAMNLNFYTLCVIYLVYSFLGWVGETVVATAKGRRFTNRGVASGPLTATFLLPFAMGACEALGGNVLTDAFGIVAMVAMTPLVAIQVLGLVYQKKSALEAERALLTAVEADEIIIYDDADQETVRLEDA